MSATRERALPLDARERRDLCDLLAELGPDAPTLCEGWATLDLAAHLVLREHFATWTEAKMSTAKAKGLPALIDRLRAGPPMLPWRIPGLRTVLNGTEFLIHHEDVRRANGRGRRTDRPDLDSLAWKTNRLTGWRAARKIRPHGLELRSPGGRTHRFGSPGGAVLTGHPVELLLYLSGRREAAETELTGDPEAVAAFLKAHTGV
ncbi:maleylpyruvate isomerase family mycothiol-dependent enzyme [Glycomyces sp. TRM65418]|uniref:maleylpyruvate isomerase family mycothiol-dependent enzyme n=1 Tax=Glycomyces sp. TRM65418 TaxID=2867006 RepID=UPI001CE4F16F|nr:maleylpyruvate isomerase family mycothiol-dependent enzyme [Glycomyces sp. TRM65418]MCC3761943.1 maleylpyruvate isomerase family mycothiol-dependent enzyme [Glycomyces sp. TRM65418]QZD56022.1 maleylpyruvate isomerase family mycothiol-dependent enzyme [Glycomyces sp. TRM65418]